MPDGDGEGVLDEAQVGRDVLDDARKRLRVRGVRDRRALQDGVERLGEARGEAVVGVALGAAGQGGRGDLKRRRTASA